MHGKRTLATPGLLYKIRPGILNKLRTSPKTMRSSLFFALNRRNVVVTRIKIIKLKKCVAAHWGTKKKF